MNLWKLNMGMIFFSMAKSLMLPVAYIKNVGNDKMFAWLTLPDKTTIKNWQIEINTKIELEVTTYTKDLKLSCVSKRLLPTFNNST